MAFTFDDLPGTRLRDAADARAVTASLLRTISVHRIPAIGFVNEGKLDADPALQETLTKALAAWRDAGADLGNHTYSHMRFYGATLEEMQADVLRGERVTSRLLGRRPKYFRHPTLNTGRSRAAKTAFERFLAHNGYRIAPVTIDNDEYLYALAYDRARGEGDAARMARIGADYIRYMEEIFAFFEALSRDFLGREPPQVLLLHANALNAEYLDELVAMVARRGYRFVSLGAALE
ncbi:MAG: polysaccharide deacetylase family protein, partial [Thermoanaerobaculia bacterium]|nr:polysaccharide deacetylase family protein [Thermoanaerobaculia bacterium]